MTGHVHLHLLIVCLTKHCALGPAVYVSLRMQSL